MIEIKNLKKLWEDDGSSVLEGINLTIEDGDIYALVGRSGAGKSTLLRCINGLTSYQEGSLKVDGCEIKDLKDKELREFRRHVGMIFQQFSLLERETVYKNVALPMQCWKYPKDQIDKKVRELLELVGLGDKMNAKPRNLSGGQKQRVAVAISVSVLQHFRVHNLKWLQVYLKGGNCITQIPVRSMPYMYKIPISPGFYTANPLLK